MMGSEMYKLYKNTDRIAAYSFPKCQKLATGVMKNLRPLWTCFKRGHIFIMSNTKNVSIEINEIRLIVIWRKNLELLVCYSDTS